MSYRTKPKPPSPPKFPPLPDNSEAGVLRGCLDYLRINRHFVFRVNGGAFKTIHGRFMRCTDINGVADIIGVTKKEGRALAVECKSNKGRLRKEQREFRDDWQSRGGLYVVARSIEDLEEAGL